MILITGVTGKTGGEAARQLDAAGVPIRALVRNPEKAAALSFRHGEVVVADAADAAAVTKALDGCDKALLVMPNGEDQLKLEKQFTDCAVAAGVQHLLYLSSLESVPESRNPITQMHVAAETHIRESGIAWTMLRPTFFMQMFSQMAPRIRETGKIVFPAGNGTVSTTDLRDVGEVIVRVVTEPGHENQSYDMTGPQLLTFDEIAAIFSEVLGRQIVYVDQPMDEFKARLRAVNMSDWRTEAVAMEMEAIARGVIDHCTGTIEQLLGRPATSLAQFIEDHRHLFA